MVFHSDISQAVKSAAAEAGFDLAGIASVSQQDFPELEAFPEWIEAGHAGEMKYLERRTETGELRRAALRNAAPWAKSVIVCALNYNAARPYSIHAHDPERGWISRYAWGEDYHDALLKKLERVECAVRELAAKRNLPVETRRYVDTGPLIERVYAKYAGIGWIAKNTCVIHPRLGSWIFLGVVLTSLELTADLPASDRCGSCTRCLDACPTQAFIAPGKMDARRCIAYLTIEKRGEIPLEFRSAIGHHVFGCDICQDVCPWNNKAGNAPPAQTPELQPRAGVVHPELEQLARMTESEFREMFRKSPVKRTKFSGLKRNVAIAMGNSGSKEFIPRLKELAADPDPIVAGHAQWALDKLRSES